MELLSMTLHWREYVMTNFVKTIVYRKSWMNSNVGYRTWKIIMGQHKCIACNKCATWMTLAEPLCIRIRGVWEICSFCLAYLLEVGAGGSKSQRQNRDKHRSSQRADSHPSCLQRLSMEQDKAKSLELYPFKWVAGSKLFLAIVVSSHGVHHFPLLYRSE